MKNMSFPITVLLLAISGGGFTSLSAEKAEKENAAPRMVKSGHFVYPKSVAHNLNIYSGYAKVMFMLSAEGKPSDAVVLETTHPLIGEAVREALPKCEYSPKIVNGKPRPARVNQIISVEYEKDFTVMDKLDFTASRMDITQTKHQYEIPAMNQLDVMPAVVETVPPEYPESLAGEGAAGEVVVDFFIDPEGSVRCAGIHEPLHPEIDLEAYRAIVQWKFEPPVKDGKPCWTRARLPMRFAPPPPREKPAEEEAAQ